MLLFNYLYQFNYNQGDILYKITHDKYLRPEIYNKIAKMAIGDLKKKKSELKEEIQSGVTWDEYDRVKSLKVDEDLTQSSDIVLESKSLEYLKTNLRAIRFQIYSISISLIFFAGMVTLYPVKRIRQHKYSHLFVIVPSFNLLLFNSYILATIPKYNKVNSGFLESNYKRQIEKYNLVLS